MDFRLPDAEARLVDQEPGLLLHPCKISFGSDRLLHAEHQTRLAYGAGVEAGELWIPLPLDYASQVPLHVEVTVDRLARNPVADILAGLRQDATAFLGDAHPRDDVSLLGLEFVRVKARTLEVFRREMAA